MTSEDLNRARAALSVLDPALARLHVVTPPFDWRRRDPGFAGLAQILVEQQISTTAAASIWGRCVAALQPFTPATILGTDEEDLRALGLSRPKVRYLRALAAAVSSGALDLDGLPGRDDEAAVAHLVAIPGVGRWTAAVYLLFCEGRDDFCPEGDIALREALRRADGAAERLDEAAFRRRADLWRPHRGAAAHLLWAFYRTGEGRDAGRGDGGAPAKRAPSGRLGAVAKKVQ